jgi:hypothetical protein
MSSEQQWSMVDKSDLANLERRIERLEGKMDEIISKLEQVLIATSAEGRSRTYNQVWRLFPGYINPTMNSRMHEHVISQSNENNNQEKENNKNNDEEVD